MKGCATVIVSLVFAGFAATGVSQPRKIERQKSHRAPFDAAVNALGMERGVQREQRSINTAFFVGNGSMKVGREGEDPSLRVVNATVSMSYYLPAIREDVSWKEADGSVTRVIQVAHGDVAWNETEPGIGASETSATAAERLAQVWLTPQGALRAMVEARSTDEGAVLVLEDEGSTVLAMDFEGAPLRVELDEEHRPHRLFWQRSGGEVEVEYSGYKDWELLDVFFPERIVQKVDGEVTMDFTVTDFRSNPYVVFPIPALLSHGE